MSAFDIDPIFKDPTLATTEGIHKYRIENKLVVPCAEVNGDFHEGDAYIVHVSVPGSGGKFVHSVHFWIGDECSVDESGIAAYKSVELDTALGGIATQYRECQNNESNLFLKTFSTFGGITYLPGGVDSGFQHVERDTWPTRLLHVKGKRNVRVNEVEVAASSLTQDDVYILDMGLKIYIWNGENCNKYEKTKGLEVITHLNNDQRGGRATIIRVTEDDPENSDFWGALGGFIPAASIPLGESDDNVPAWPANQLLRISDESGEMTQVEIPLENGKLVKDLLDSADCFLIVSQGHVYVWVGKNCNVEEKKQASIFASNFVTSSGMAKNTQIMRVSDGHESSAFKALFAQWAPFMSFKRQANIAAAQEDKDIDVSALLAGKAKQEQSVDDGSGVVEVFAVKNFKLEPLDSSKYGEFYGGDSYVISYTYLVSGRERGLIYFWLGNDSTSDERGTAALLTKEMDDTKYRGSATQIRVTQGKEPPHFRSIFRGLMIVHSGGNASGFAGVEGNTKDESDTALFHVKGTNPSNTCGVQVACSASSLNGEDCFVLVDPSNCYMWFGNASDGAEQAAANGIAEQLSKTFQNTGGRSVSQIKEGEEDDSFWAALGGKGEYSQYAPGTPPPRAARLFEATTAKGTFNVDEIESFVQEDLCNDDCYLLDTYNQLFVWCGSGSTEEERRKTAELAEKFIANATDGRDSDMCVLTVAAGNEPFMFTQHFLGWDPLFMEKRSFSDPYAARLALMQAEQAKALEAQAAADASRSDAFSDPLAVRRAALEAEAEAKRAALLAEDSSTSVEPAPVATVATGTFTAEQLRGRVPGVDATRKETYLADEEFNSVFNMSRSDFAALPAWKAKAAKQKVGLF